MECKLLQIQSLNKNENIIMFCRDFESLLKYLRNRNQSNDVIRQRANKNLLKSLQCCPSYCFVEMQGKAFRIRQYKAVQMQAKEAKESGLTGRW